MLSDASDIRSAQQQKLNATFTAMLFIAVLIVPTCLLVPSRLRISQPESTVPA